MNEKERGREGEREGGRAGEGEGRGRERERERERERSYIFHFTEGIPEYVYLSQTLFDGCCLVVLGYIIQGITA